MCQCVVCLSAWLPLIFLVFFILILLFVFSLLFSSSSSFFSNFHALSFDVLAFFLLFLFSCNPFPLHLLQDKFVRVLSYVARGT